jgi:hypothetical protein
MIRATALLACLGAGTAQAGDCRMALVLALDVSASVDAREYGLQMQGMAAALLSPAVTQAFLAPGEPPVALAAFTFSGPQDAALISPFRLIDSPDALRDTAARIAATPRRSTFDGRTALGAALQHGARLLAEGPACPRRVIDIAADGQNNAGPAPRIARATPALTGVEINALSIGGDLPRDPGTFVDEGGQLSRYLAREVIQGPDAFVEPASDYADFEHAMTRKLLRELRAMMLGATAP